MFFVIKDARASVLIKEAIEVRFEPVSTTTSNVKVLYVLVGGTQVPDLIKKFGYTPAVVSDYQ